MAIGRFVKEKNFHLLIDAFSRVAPEGIRLVIAGDADMPDDYSESLKRQAKDAGVVLTGFIRQEAPAADEPCASVRVAFHP